MKNSELKIINDNAHILNNLIGAEIVMALAENLDMIEAKVKILDAVIKPTKEYEAMIELQSSSFKKYADVDKEGMLVITEGSMHITNAKKLKEYNTELTKIIDDNKEHVDIHNKKLDEYKKALDKEVKISFIKIDKEDIPDEITLMQLRLIKFMINRKK